MEKLRLDFFLSLGLKLVMGDKLIQILVHEDKKDFTMTKTGCENWSVNCIHDDKRFIESFAPRKNTGDQPCGGYVPVVVEYLDESENRLAGMSTWQIDCQLSDITYWKPDLPALIKMQAEHDNKASNIMEKLTSKDIEWQEGDVCAVVRNGRSEPELRFSFESQHCAMSNQGKGFNFNGHKFNIDFYYIVTREAEPVKTVFDAVCEFGLIDIDNDVELYCVNRASGGAKFSAEEFNQCVTDLTGDPLYHYAWLTALNDMRRQKEEQTTEEVLHGLFDKSRSPWVNLANLCGKMAKEHPVEVFADSNNNINKTRPCEEIPAIKPTYTKEMKDAGELPSVSMECVIAIPHDDCESVITYIGDKVGCAINKSTGKEFSFTCATGSFVFQPIDTRIPEQKQVDEIMCASLESGYHINARYIAFLQKAGLLAEIKSLFVVGGE